MRRLEAAKFVAIMILTAVIMFSARSQPAQAQVQAQSAADAGADFAVHLQQIAGAYLAARAEPEHITGVALEVDLGGSGTSFFVSSGTDGRDFDPQSVNRDTLFQTGSNTKGFTGVLLLKLEAQGRLNLAQQTLIAYWPQYDLAISASANSAVAATGKDDQLGVSTVPRSTQRCRMRT
jgi:CubicO group peptidase (beta-lactamase class C family)